MNKRSGEDSLAVGRYRYFQGFSQAATGGVLDTKVGIYRYPKALTTRGI